MDLFFILQMTYPRDWSSWQVGLCTTLGLKGHGSGSRDALTVLPKRLALRFQLYRNKVINLYPIK